MIKLRIISVGKMKEKYWLAAQEEYAKRLKRFAKLEIVELPDMPTPESPSEAEKNAVLKKEGENVLRAIKGYDIVCVLAIEGKELSSEALAKRLGEYFNMGRSICFVIGGSFGLSDEVKEKADILLSFSPMTFPHRLMRIILLEQIYRSFKINADENYHK